MKALVLLPILLMVIYFSWTRMSRRERTAMRRTVRQHVVPLSLIVGLVLAGVWIAVNFASIQVL